MVTLPALFGNPAYASLVTALFLLAVGSLALYADERAARRTKREGVLPPDPTASGDPGPAVGELPALVVTPARGDALN